jgi:hypothetical protein
MCAFCSADAVEKGGEHIWDDWLNKELPDGTYHARKQLSLDLPPIEYDTHTLDEKLPTVCTACNNGWMGELTAKTKLLFMRAILHGEPFTLNLRDAALLAAFAFMKAVVTDHAIDVDGHGPFFSRAARERFKRSLEVPPVVKMWFGTFQGRARMSTKNHLGVFNPVDDIDQPSPLDGHEFCSHTYVVGNLCLQLLGVRWKNIRNSGKPLLSLKPDAFWEPAATLFWPYPGIVSWPPPKYLGDNIIQTFIYRFKTSVTIRMGRIGNDWYFLT